MVVHRLTRTLNEFRNMNIQPTEYIGKNSNFCVRFLDLVANTHTNN